ncbi:MAG: PAAR domain-containing protein [Pseudomonadota bacterium]
MPACARQSDICTGHGCFPPRPATAGSPDVFANGLPVHRVGDGWALHGCPTCIPHTSVLASGSPDVFANGQPVGRIGDPVACGSKVATGSPNVFVN